MGSAIEVLGLDLVQPGRLHRVTFTLPPPTDTDIVIKVTHCGICQSDIKAFKGELSFLGKEMYGHEIVGKVVWVGEKIKDVTVGDCVSSWWHPGYANYAVVPMGHYLKVPECHIRWNLQPIACCVCSLFYLPPEYIDGHDCLVIGSGFNALVLAHLLPKATFVGHYNKEVFKSLGISLKDWSDIEGARFPVIIDASGHTEPQRILEHICVGGTLIWLAPPETKMPNLFDFSWQSIKVFFPSPRSPFFPLSYTLSAGLVACGRIHTDLLFTHSFHIRDYQMAFETIAYHRPPNLVKAYFIHDDEDE
jgi:threonine dehydrogenase-like Zn-dependent dehydrogenase